MKRIQIEEGVSLLKMDAQPKQKIITLKDVMDQANITNIDVLCDKVATTLSQYCDARIDQKVIDDTTDLLVKLASIRANLINAGVTNVSAIAENIAVYPL